jgi:para-aminobenzoate synthetase component 1
LKFVLPEIWVGLDRDGQVHGSAEGLSLWEQIQTAEIDIAQYAEMDAIVQPSVTWSPLTSRETYLNSVAKIQAGIVEGDYYEMNHCVAFTATAEIDPYMTFMKLNGKAPAPFACFLKDGDQFLLSASPERFIAQKGKELVSQPIKGTRKRQLAEDQTQADTEAVASLKESEKDRAENIMIVDLVRNDMSRVCNSGSVQVPALCEVYTYSHVHQMISTVRGQLKEGTNVKEIVHATFPMGSMTGAPKIAVMQATEGLENFSRGIYSGTVGYVWKDTMDLNVVIRSLMYDASKQQLSYAVGGAITIDSVATEEYQECLDKAATVLSIFG